MPGREVRVAIALGGNLGDMPKRFVQACGVLQTFLRQLKMASCIMTKPVDCVPGTPDFYNSAVTGFWKGTPLELLDRCQQVELAFGRPAIHSSRESRTLDLDLLLYGQEMIETPRLLIPHPRMLQRHFVLEPLAEIAPDWLVPTTALTVKQHLDLLLRKEC